ncbi:MAG: response regulator [Treponema sp.]
MKQVLIIDASPMFREFLKEKLTAEKVSVEIANGKRDAFTKLISTLPDLVIIDVEESMEDLIDFLESKHADPNARTIPIIISGPIIAREKVATLAQFGVLKYFTKPIKFDIFFESIGKILRAAFTIDVTPCVLEIHINGNIIFIEIAQGLNREKLALLKYKLPEIIDANHIVNPKLIIMMTDLQLSFVDGANLELLFDNVTVDSRIQKKNIKVLSLDSFTRELIDGHPQYDGIEVTNNLNQVLNSLVESGPTTNIHELVTDKILAPDEKAEQGSVEMRFVSDTGVISNEDKNEGNVLKIAIVDDDAVVRKLLQAAFATISAETVLFTSGAEFLQATGNQSFDLVILDIYMTGLSGFDILKSLQERGFTTPIIVYSQATQREAVVQALTLGAKSYLVKPQKPEVIIQKAVDVLHAEL